MRCIFLALCLLSLPAQAMPPEIKLSGPCVGAELGAFMLNEAGLYFERAREDDGGVWIEDWSDGTPNRWAITFLSVDSQGAPYRCIVSERDAWLK